MYLAKMFQRRADGSKREYWVLKTSYWDPKTKRPRHKYLAYIGTRHSITEAKAKELAKKAAAKLGISEEEAFARLRKVKRLRIVADKDVKGGA